VTNILMKLCEIITWHNYNFGVNYNIAAQLTIIHVSITCWHSNINLLILKFIWW